MAGERAHLVPLTPRTLTVAWLQRVRDALELEDMSKRELARKVKTSAGTIQQLLGDVPPKSSRFVDRICKVLELPPPGVDDEDALVWNHYRDQLLAADPAFYRAVSQKIAKRLRGSAVRPD